MALLRPKVSVAAIAMFAALSGVVVALFTGSPVKATPLDAANHCTHYWQDVYGDSSGWCGEAEDVPAVDDTHTPGSADRDDNIAAMSTDQLVCVSYDPGVYHVCNNVSSSEATDGAAAGYAYCTVGDGGWGVCKTDWHD